MTMMTVMTSDGRRCLPEDCNSSNVVTLMESLFFSRKFVTVYSTLPVMMMMIMMMVTMMVMIIVTLN